MRIVTTFEAATSPGSASMTPLEKSGDKTRSDAGKPIEAAPGARFHIFVIDTGWNSAASKVVREHLHMIRDLNIDEEVYVLDRATSIALLRYYPLQVGRDPIIAVHDLRLTTATGSSTPMASGCTLASWTASNRCWTP